MNKISDAARNREAGPAGGRSDRTATTVAANPQCPCQLRFDILEAQLFRASPCNDQEVMGRLQIIPMIPKKLSNESLDPVASHRVADLPAHGDSEPTLGLRAWGEDHDEVRALLPPAPTLESQKIRSLA